ncbi:methyltransferase domain-containing protein [Catenovulum sp. SM1970]|uniref:methyltransferase domain-containing protein n=1 Tax=Marinifaba aquimaris TaxID=2741323 RepID=UPI0015740268|nr:methyltransferase domain-containing protein [Marinifaba aquimaris]NTS76019.1 methyltransferase domain-containing protein [Marinifaba aquimaris]
MYLTSTQKKQVAASFSKAATQYDNYARLQHWTVKQVCQRLGLADSDLSTIRLLDLGCGTANIIKQLTNDFPEKAWLYTGIDISAGMLSAAEQKLKTLNGHQIEANFAIEDVEQFSDSTQLMAKQYDYCVSSLAIQWCDLDKVCQQLAQFLQLNPSAEIVMSTLLEGSLAELNQAWQSVDPAHSHVNEFLSFQVLKQALIQASLRYGFSFELEQDWHHLSYSSALAVMQELKHIGANQVVTQNAKQFYLTKEKLKQLEQAYPDNDDGEGTPQTTKIASWHLGFIKIRRA